MKKRALKKHLENLFRKYPGITFCRTSYLPDGDINTDCPLDGRCCEDCILVERQYKPTRKPSGRKELLMYITCFENEIVELKRKGLR